LTPNIALDFLASRRSVGIDATLDLGDAFGVAVNHASDCDRASDEESNNRNQQTAQAQNRVDYSSHSPFSRRLKPFSFGPLNAALKGRSSATSTSGTILVELTGIEPVASWLQTRRSPS
jgi:hypothetical protein